MTPRERRLSKVGGPVGPRNRYTGTRDDGTYFEPPNPSGGPFPLKRPLTGGFPVFKHLTSYRIERRGKVWFVVSADGSREWGPYTVFKNAWNRRKAEVAGTTYHNARGLPS